MDQVVAAARTVQVSFPGSGVGGGSREKLKPESIPMRFYKSKERNSSRCWSPVVAVANRMSRVETEVLPVSPEDTIRDEEKFRHLKGMQQLNDALPGVWLKPNVRRKTKIVCTIGPSTNTREMIWKLAEAGMNVARLNMSHGDHASHQKVIDLVKEYNAQSKDNVIAIMLDTKGPEVRSGDVPQPINLETGEEFTFTIKRGVSTETCVSVNYDDFVNDVEVGDMLLVDGGMMSLTVKSKTEDSVKCEVVDGGELKSRRHLNVRGKSATLPSITEKDWEDIKFGVENGVDYYAVSFVKDAQVVHELKDYLRGCGADIHVIVKIESADSIPNLHSIITASDGAMVARGELKSRRHLNVRGKSATLPSITEKDWEDIKFGVENGVDYYAVSFVKDAQVVHELKDYLRGCGADIHVIVKIESADSIPNLHSIITASDGAMVARGDLGAELPIEEVPLLQEEIIRLCRSMGKAVIVATNMLESMIVHPTPTRAEVSDIAIAVREGADAVMLSGETAHGKYPLKAVKVMHTVSLRTEATIVGGEKPANLGEAFKNHMSEMFAYHATMMSNTLGTSIVVFTRSGFMAILLSHYRPSGTIFAFTDEERVRQRLALYQGVCPINMQFSNDAEKTFADALSYLQKQGMVKEGEEVALVQSGKQPIWRSHSTHNIQGSQADGQTKEATQPKAPNSDPHQMHLDGEGHEDPILALQQAHNKPGELNHNTEKYGKWMDAGYRRGRTKWPRRVEEIKWTEIRSRQATSLKSPRGRMVVRSSAGILLSLVFVRHVEVGEVKVVSLVDEEAKMVIMEDVAAGFPYFKMLIPRNFREITSWIKPLTLETKLCFMPLLPSLQSFQPP
ncbi:hypothetical protein J5N97_004593 [Dioscorea zingiberensis]|uniref:Pyruvate kinase n=1 Tax=Dioscorea zingiberensis TaxID=325984 RepID=A0A9D5HSA4_9LILI|nr:hypothetical protein J5N97_004593 [Dioscorea zingiberensis]